MKILPEVFVFIFVIRAHVCLLFKVTVQLCCRGIDVVGTGFPSLTHFSDLINSEYQNLMMT